MLHMRILNMQPLIELFSYGFIQRAFLAGFIVAIIAPLIGGFLVVRKISLIADALSHVALAGVAIGLLLGVNPLITTVVCTIITAYTIEVIRSNRFISAESILAMILPGGLAVALILMSITKGFSTNIFTYLFGSILTVTSTDVWMILLLGIGILTTLFVTSIIKV